ncbi:MAG: hypothetical protein Q7T96_13050 [Methylobacter sp.]|nr:hypothetical protein [Methylobacter sp.]
MNRIIDGIDAISTASHLNGHVECQTPGGWEDWLQVELHRWLLQQPWPVNIGREVHCYTAPNAAQKCDLTLGNMVVELKAMGLGRPSAAFVTLVINDKAKILQGRVMPFTTAGLAVVIPNIPNNIGLGIQCATARNNANIASGISVPTTCGCYQIYIF